MMKCKNCGSTNIGVRNAYRHPKPDPKLGIPATVGFKAEEYCKKCGVALSQGKRMKERRERIFKHLEKRDRKYSQNHNSW